MADISLLEGTNFVLTEFDNFAGISTFAFMTLDRFRVEIDRPIIILADFAKDGHSTGSYHYSGYAFDIAILEGGKRMHVFDQYALAERFGEWHGIGVYPEGPFIHIDVRPKRHTGRWIRKDGVYMALNWRNLISHF